jgi:hypothetical protein
MTTSSDKSPKRTFHDLVKTAFDKPQVRLIVDLADFDSKELVVKVLFRYASSFGALVDSKIYTPVGKAEWGDDHLQALTTDVVNYVQNSHSRCIYIVVSTNPFMHNQVADLIATRGNIAILLGKESRETAAVTQHDLAFYMPLNRLSNHGEKVDVHNYDFEGFIKLLLTSEQKMPFVGVKYFINKVMWRLGPGYADPTLSQEVFQAAREKGIVEMQKQDNVNPNAMPVSACRVNRSHELVQKVLAGMRDDSGTPGLSHRMDLSGVNLSDSQEDSGGDEVETPI